MVRQVAIYNPSELILIDQAETPLHDIRLMIKRCLKELNIALNKITGAWNEQLLADLIVDLQSVDFNTDLTGFEAPEIEQLFSKVHNKDIKEDDFDVAEELKNPPISQKGDIWLLGRHRVICGDSTLSLIHI